MKNYQYIFALPVIAIGLSSCNKILDEQQPHNVTTEDELFSTSEGFQRAVEGVYSLGFDAWGDNLFFTGEAQGNNIRQIDASNEYYVDVFNFVHKTMDLWTPNYILIQNANLIIEHAGSSNDSIIQEAKAEALFCRAFAYFNLVRLFGRPYYQSPETNPGAILVVNSNDDGVRARNTVKECYDRIVSDLMNSVPRYTQNRGSSYASKYASEALLSRVYLYMGGTFESPVKAYNDSVVKYASEVIDKGPYTLAQGDDYVNYFENQNNSAAATEDIFAINSELSYSGLYRYYMANGTTPAYYVPSPDLVALTFAETGDLRQKLMKKADIVMGNFGDTLETVKYDMNGDGSKAPFRHIRLIEMYLNRAEAYAKLGEDNNALLDLNVVRERAGLTALPEGSLSGQNLFNAIFDQRRIEFAFESQIGFDYFRNGLTMKRNYESTAAVGITNVQEITPTDARILLRIPSDELLKNRYLKQNEQ